MRFADPLSLRDRSMRVATLFAASQLQGERPTQDDYFLNYNDECFALADGLGGTPNGASAAKLACETAVWAYRHVRLRPFYWGDKKLFLKRIFRSTNITLWQKRREKEFEQGLLTTLITCIVGERGYWLGSAGDSRAYFLGSDGHLKCLTHDDRDPSGRLTKVLGRDRYGLVPQVFTGTLGHHESILLVTDGVWQYCQEQGLEDRVKQCGETVLSLTETVVDILQTAQKNGGEDNMTAILIKRVIHS